jgi:UDP-glucose 4-epimerase
VARQADRVLVVDNLINSRRENIEEVLSKQVMLHVTDIHDIERMESLMKGAEVVFHLACLGVRHSIHSPRENHDVTAAATLGLIEATKNCGVQHLDYLSSADVSDTAGAKSSVQPGRGRLDFPR